MFALFIANPILLLGMGGLFLLGYLLVRRSATPTADRRARALLIPAALWALWGIWESFLAVLSPEANLRVDLLMIVPIVLIVSAVGLWFALRR